MPFHNNARCIFYAAQDLCSNELKNVLYCSVGSCHSKDKGEHTCMTTTTGNVVIKKFRSRCASSRGARNSPLARWAAEGEGIKKLVKAYCLGQMGRGHSGSVSMRMQANLASGVIQNKRLKHPACIKLRSGTSVTEKHDWIRKSLAVHVCQVGV